MPTGTRRIGPALSRVQRGLLKKPIRKANEGPLVWYKRLKRWMDTTEKHEEWKKRQRSKPKAKAKAKPKKKLTERERRIKARKEAEAMLGVKRGVKKKKTPPRKKKKK